MLSLFRAKNVMATMLPLRSECKCFGLLFDCPFDACCMLHVTHALGLCTAVGKGPSAVARDMCYTSHVTRHTSHITRHTSHVTRHTSVTRHAADIGNVDGKSTKKQALPPCVSEFDVT